MGSAAFGCILTEDVDDIIARQCEAVIWLGCACGGCAGHPGHGVTLTCAREKHGDGELHRDLDGIEWREAVSRG